MTDHSGATTAMVFPGMGPAGFSDVGRFMLADRRARELVRRADEVLGYSLTGAYRDCDDPYGEYAQVAFLVNCLALARCAEEDFGVTAPVLCAGASFGEKTAAAWAGSLCFEDAVRLTAESARCVREYFQREHRDIVTLSFVRIPDERLGDLLETLAARGEWYEVSCRVDEDLHMVSLREAAVAEFAQAIRARGGMTLYSMRPPMHAAAFGGLRARVEKEVFDGVEFADPLVPVVSDQDGTVLSTADEIRDLLLDGYVRPLRWPDVVVSMRQQGVNRVCVAGPDSLFGRVRATTANFEVVAVTPRAALTPRTRADGP